MKKVILMIVTLIFFAQICYAEGFELTVDSKTAKAGETVTIDLTFSNNPGIIAALFELEYDKGCLELVKAEDKGLLKGAVFSQTYENYPYIMLWNSSSAKNFTDNGTLVTLTFKVLDNPEKNTANIRISYNPENVYDADLNNVKIDIKNGLVNITDIPPTKENNVSGNRGHSSTGVSYPKEPSKPAEEKKHTFSDVNTNDWYYDATAYVVEKGLMKGTSETSFSPELTLTRAMLVTILYRNENSPSVNGSNVFEDVKTDMYYADAVKWAKDNKIVSGVSDKQFAPDLSITREQLVSILYRYAKYKNFDTTADISLVQYHDFKDISDYAVAPVQYAVGKGLIKGNSATTINPHGNATRAETATILYRFLK